GCNLLSEILPNIDAFNNIHPHFHDDPLSGSTTYSANSLLEEFTDELALIIYPPDYDDNLQFDIEFDLEDIAFLLYHGLMICPSPDNEDKVFNPGILIHEKSVTIITRVAQEKKLAISYASLVFKDFEPPFCAPLFFKDDYLDCEVFRALSFSFTKASHPQLHFGNPVSKSYRLTFSFGIPNKRP
nr:hypothetical protein [Tanacetum cinerariifolium]